MPWPLQSTRPQLKTCGRSMTNFATYEIMSFRIMVLFYIIDFHHRCGEIWPKHFMLVGKQHLIQKVMSVIKMITKYILNPKQWQCGFCKLS